MSDRVVLFVDRLMTPPATAASEEEGKLGKVEVALAPAAEKAGASAGPSCSRSEGEEHEEDEPLIQGGECRICQEEDSIHNLESPCGCSGSLKYAHRKCVQHWCNEKGDIICEICHKPYEPGYTAPPRPPRPEDTVIDIGGGWTISGTPIDLRDPRLLAIAEAERHFLEAEYEEYAASNASGAAFCRSAALILMALLLLRHALTVTEADSDDDDVSTFFSVTFLATRGWFPPPVLHHGLGCKHLATKKATTRSCSISSNASRIRAAIWTASRCAFHDSIRTACSYASRTRLIASLRRIKKPYEVGGVDD
ncbi:E3 ubiquitin-protein ligase MARCHF3 [Linum grandiflorum]